MEYKISKYLEMLEEENKKQNLVSRKSLAEEICKHVQDSLEANQFIDISGQNLVDIGSGAGFPGLILSISRPDC